MKIRKGQGAEYLVLLAVVLIIALISIALLGFFPWLATDSKQKQSDAYWTGVASPFKIKEHAVSSSGSLQAVIENSGPDKLTVASIYIGGVNYTTSTVFNSGDSKTLTLGTFSSNPCANNTRYEVSGSSVIFSYTTKGGLSKKQGGDSGTKDLVGTCT